MPRPTMTRDEANAAFRRSAKALRRIQTGEDRFRMEIREREKGHFSAKMIRDRSAAADAD